MSDTAPRRASQRALPPYSYVPGLAPHPIRDPRGHSYGAEHAAAAPLPDDLQAPEWLSHEAFLYGIDLFNHGFFWEAHETWEGLWNASGRRGPAADFLKGLIKLAAAGVKACEGRPAGVARHAARAIELWQWATNAGLENQNVPPDDKAAATEAIHAEADPAPFAPAGRRVGGVSLAALAAVAEQLQSSDAWRELRPAHPPPMSLRIPWADEE